MIEELRKIAAFSDLPEDHLAWLVSKFDDLRFRPGEVIIQVGDPANWLAVVLEGEFRLQRTDVPDSPIFTVRGGEITGKLPYSRLTEYRGTGIAIQPTRILRLHEQYFPEMVSRMPQLGQRLVALMADRIRETTRMEQQRDKLMSLGKLSAGLAHELNNPAAAAQRAVKTLKESLLTLREASIRLHLRWLTPEQWDFLSRFEIEAMAQGRQRQFDPVALADREDRLTAWLESYQVAEPWKVSSPLAEGGLEPAQLDSIVEHVGSEALADVLTRLANWFVLERLVEEVDASTKRISELVRAVKEYSYMDQARLQEVDIHQSLETTLVILGHRLKQGVTVTRDYEAGLPRVCAFGSELNQVWTNLIDNALDAMDGKGEIRLRTRRELDRVMVEIGDNGPGVPPDVQPHIFEPFFTTKGVGKGTGLGLDTVCRIIRNHHGDISLDSKPGDTRFQVRLPLDQPRQPKEENHADI